MTQFREEMEMMSSIQGKARIRSMAAKVMIESQQAGILQDLMFFTVKVETTVLPVGLLVID